MNSSTDEVLNAVRVAVSMFALPGEYLGQLSQFYDELSSGAYEVDLARFRNVFVQIGKRFSSLNVAEPSIDVVAQLLRRTRGDLTIVAATMLDLAAFLVEPRAFELATWGVPRDPFNENREVDPTLAYLDILEALGQDLSVLHQPPNRDEVERLQNASRGAVLDVRTQLAAINTAPLGQLVGRMKQHAQTNRVMAQDSQKTKQLQPNAFWQDVYTPKIVDDMSRTFYTEADRLAIAAVMNTWANALAGASDLKSAYKSLQDDNERTIVALSGYMTPKTVEFGWQENPDDKTMVYFEPSKAQGFQLTVRHDDETFSGKRFDA